MPELAFSYLPPFAKRFFEEQHCCPVTPVPLVDLRLTEKGGLTLLDKNASDLKGDHQLQPVIARHQTQQGKPYFISICA